MGKPVRSLPSSRPRRKRTVAAVMPKRAASRRRGGPTTGARVGNKSSSAAPGSGYGGAVDGVLPPEMLHEVLLRLPAKPICRLRTVCRSWRSFTSDPLFAAAHAARHPPSRRPPPRHRRAELPQILCRSCRPVWRHCQAADPKTPIPSGERHGCECDLRRPRLPRR